MAVGDVTNPKRVRMQANERVDTVDADAYSIAAREHLDAYSKAVEAAPRNVGASAPTGLIIQGFGLTLNPTGASDNKVRVQPALGVAFDADGRMLVKEAGIQVDLTLPAGNSQIYAYYVETDSDTAVRRRISVSSPYVESGAAIPTKLTGGVGFVTRAGDQTSIVASDVISGATTPLCFLGVAANTAGVITMTGYNATTTPNGAFATNRITSVVTPAALPAGSAGNGSVGSMHDLVTAALFMIGQLGWKGSRNVAPAASNNFQAWAPPTTRGLDALFDAIDEATVTPTTVWRDWNLNRRALVDHNGYRMGQVSELAENWNVLNGTVLRTWAFTPLAAQRVSGSGGGFGVAPDPQMLAINAVAQWVTFLAPPASGMYTVLSGAVTMSRTVGTDVVAFSLSSVRSLSDAVFATGSSTSGTGTAVTSLTVGGNGFFHVLPSGTIKFSANGTTVTGTNHISVIAVTVVVDPPGWEFVPTGLNQTTRTYEGPTAEINQACVHLFSFGNLVGADVGALVTLSNECFLDANVCYVQEWIMRTGTITHAGNNRTLALGIQNNNGGGGNRFVYFYNQNTQTNWQIRVVGSSTTDTDTGVAIAANTNYRMRLEILGANVSSAGAGAFRIRGYINGTKVVDVVNSTLPTADMIRPYFHIGTTSNALGVYDYKLGAVRRAWNHLLNGDNL